MSKIEIFCTVGPSSINKKFLKEATNNNVSLLRINLSHIEIKKLEKTINDIKNYSNIPICLDTEGAQIRSKISKKKFFKKGDIFFINKKNKINFYPEDIVDKFKNGDILDIGFEGLKIKYTGKNKFLVINQGNFENNKGVHILNRKVNLDFLTKKDVKAIKIAKNNKIKNFALSFTNSYLDVKKFNKILPNERKIYKIETKSAIKNLDKILKHGENFLIDRGDLSKDIMIENVPVAQREILRKAKKNRKNIYIATNFLESMIHVPYPTRAEVNDIFNALEMGSKGLVLAAETAIGKYPVECIQLIKKVIKTYQKSKKYLRFS
jgi:pyruvate kinase